MRRFLIIRFRRVGDAILTAALCTSLRRSFPEATIDYVLNEGVADLYQAHPDVDRVIVFNSKENANFIRYLAKVWRVMRAGNYDAIIDTRSTCRTLLFSLFSLRTPYRIGTQKSYSHFVHNYPIDNASDKNTSVITHLLKLLAPLERERDITYCREFSLYVTNEQQQVFRTYMMQQGIDFSRPVILVAVAARLARKAWPCDKMKDILCRIIKAYRAQIIFNYAGEAEAEVARRLYEEMGGDKHIFIHIRANSLLALSALMVNSHFFFGNEGGPRHIAQALGVPAFAIYPPGISKKVWLPNEQNPAQQGISPDDILSVEQQRSLSFAQRFNLITADEVWQSLSPMLNQYLPSRPSG